MIVLQTKKINIVNMIHRNSLYNPFISEVKDLNCKVNMLWKFQLNHEIKGQRLGEEKNGS